jgi:acyl carrier protein
VRSIAKTSDGTTHSDSVFCNEGDAIEIWSSNSEAGAKKEEYMTHRERIIQAVYQAVDALNAQLKDKHVDKSLDEPLYGKNSDLDSLDFAAFIMEVEDKVKKEFNKDITIAENDLFTGQDGPFATISGVIVYLERVLEDVNGVHQN